MIVKWITIMIKKIVDKNWKNTVKNKFSEKWKRAKQIIEKKIK